MKIAITGGIGSGKSFVCRCLETRGINVYDCDAAAKHLMRTSRELQHQLNALLGKDIFFGGELSKAELAKFILSSPINARAVNDIVHPAVAFDFENSGNDWLESAILFESEFINRVSIDKIVYVAAPKELRLSRIMWRDGIDREKAQAWINRQMPQSEVMKRSDYTIFNDGEHDVEAQVKQLLEKLKADYTK